MINGITRKHHRDLYEWLKDYHQGELTQQIQYVLKPRKAKASQPKPGTDKPNTLCYACHDNTRDIRIDQLRRAWESFGWIEKDMDIDDFALFFKGGNRDCHINWIKPANLLTLLMGQLFESDLFEKQEKCAAKIIVKNQFKKIPNYKYGSINEETRRRIQFSIRILDYNQPLLKQNSNHRESYDEDTMTWQRAISEGMHITK